MKTENVIVEKSYIFSLQIIELYKILHYSKREFVISKQILRSGTAIGSNLEEAIGAQSQKDFISKVSIAYKEGRETRYWLRLLNDSKLIETEITSSLIQECEEILKIITSILNTLKQKSHQN